MAIRLRAEGEPARTRTEYWHHAVGTALVPYQLSAVGAALRSEIRLSQLGALTVLDFHMSALRAVRRSGLIGKSDMGLVKVDSGIRGRGRCEQEGRQNLLAPGEFQLADLSRPSHVAIDESQGIALLPVRERGLRELAAVRFAADGPYASLVASLGREVTRRLDAYDSVRGARVGAAFLDMLALAVAARLDRVADLPPESRQQAILSRAQAFIEGHLADPGLAPATVAAA